MTFLLRCTALAAVLLPNPPVKAADTAALAKRLHNAADSSSLDDPALKPWHLKLAVQLYDAKGTPSESGTIEEWWTPDVNMRVYDSPSYSATEMRNKQALHRTSGQPTVPYLLDAIRELVVHPMASAEEVDGAQPELRVEAFGKTKMDCIMLDQPIKNVAYPPMGLFPTYCLGQNSDMLRLSYRYGSESSALNTMGIFQGRKIAIDSSISTNGIRQVSAHVAVLEGKVLEPALFAFGPELEEHSGKPAKIEAAVMAGMIVNKVSPIYPNSAKVSHTTGTVHLAAHIGTDGHIHTLTIIDADAPSLALSALAAVRQWTYRPYLLNGIATDVDTTIAVHYNMN